MLGKLFLLWTFQISIFIFRYLYKHKPSTIYLAWRKKWSLKAENRDPRQGSSINPTTLPMWHLQIIHEVKHQYKLILVRYKPLVDWRPTTQEKSWHSELTTSNYTLKWQYFLQEITYFANQRTCCTSLVINMYSWIFFLMLDGFTILSHPPLRPDL